ncbi:MAG: hypothetical protein GY720_14715 [bacterium]|nr:hypothetical protein [bacterium]
MMSMDDNGDDLEKVAHEESKQDKAIDDDRRHDHAKAVDDESEAEEAGARDRAPMMPRDDD